MFCIPERGAVPASRLAPIGLVEDGAPPDWLIAAAIERAAVAPKDVFCAGVSGEGGPAGTYRWQGPSRVSLFVAHGAKQANPDLTVIVSADAATLAGLALKNLLAAARRDHGLACLAWESKESPGLDLAELVRQAGATFVARAWAGDPEQAAG